MKRALVHNWCPDLASDHRPTWWADHREDCPDCARAPSGGVIAWMLLYLFLLYALLVWGVVRQPEAVPPAHAGGNVGTHPLYQPKGSER